MRGGDIRRFYGAIYLHLTLGNGDRSTPKGERFRTEIDSDTAAELPQHKFQLLNKNYMSKDEPTKLYKKKQLSRIAYQLTFIAHQ